ncbi:MAG: hypothetical protein H7A09_10930 [Oceanospirillaceae bacterium]|nr:hypothetical protein [Oceanospirillaceae bacterium]
MAAFQTHAGEAVQLRNSYAGYLSFELAAGSFLTNTNETSQFASDRCNAIRTQATSSANLKPLPSGSTIEKAFLYWVGSYNSANQSPDYSINFAGQTVTASRMYTDVFAYNGTNYDFFSGIADVTNIVRTYGSGTYSANGLSFNTGIPPL